MSEPEINKALAEWDGWKLGTTEDQSFVDPLATITHERWLNPNGFPFRKVPDFCQDLNEVHRLEGKLIFSKRQQYYRQLKLGSKTESGNYLADIELVHATALQRCEALCRTLNIWKD